VQIWVEVFVIVAAIAIIIQMAILAGMLVSMREMMRKFQEMQAKIDPIISRSSRLLEESSEKISAIGNDAVEITRLARLQAQKMDRVLTEVADRLSDQVVRVDHIVSGALEVVEETGIKVKRTLWAPLHQVSAVLRGLIVGLEVLRNQQRGANPETLNQDEELFI
jgi:hypothetical protein